VKKRPWHAHYPASVPASIEIEDVSLPEQLARSAKQFPNRDALIFQNAHLSYRTLDDQVSRLGTALEGLGVRPGDRVAIQLPNIPQCVIAFYATLRIGAVPCMTNPLYVSREIEHQWKDCDARVAVVADFIYETRIREIRDRLPVKHYIIASIPEYLRFPLNVLAPLKLRRTRPPSIATVAPGAGIHFFRQLVNQTTPALSSPRLDPRSTAVLLYTGGTTGVSKGAALTHRNLSANVQQMTAWFVDQRPGEEVQLAALPYFHSFGMTVAMTFPIAIAATIVLIPNPRDISAVLKAIVRHRVTLAPQVPAMFNAINQFPQVDRLDLKSIKVCNSGSAPLSVDVLHRFEHLTGARIVEGYGLTETSPVTHCNPAVGLCKVGTIGIPLPGTDARVVDLENGVTDVPLGTEGELILQGPQVMPGYWHRPEETSHVLRDGWLYTGDIATVDADGYFRIVGRKKDMIIASGYKVFPDEVDRVLMSHPAVLEAATIGLPDAKRGETVKSFVVLKPGRQASIDDLLAHAGRDLAPYKVPREIEFREALPRSSVMKILRRELRAEEMKKRDQGSGIRD
jgi:long-chain acyl-CoA synthetase